MNTTKEQLINKIYQLQEEKDSKFIKLPFEILIEQVRHQKITNSSVTDKLTYTEFLRIKFAFERLTKNPLYRFHEEEGAKKIVKAKCQMGEFWELKEFVAYISYNHYKVILEMYPEVVAKMKDYEGQINDLKQELESLSNNEYQNQ